MNLIRITFVAMAALGPIGLAGCALHQSSGIDALQRQPAREFRGHYTVADGSWFTPCGAAPADGPWWVTVTGQAATQAEAARREGRLTASAPVFVRWQGVETRGGEVGPRGPGKPALLIREISDLRPASPRDCAENAAR